MASFEDIADEWLRYDERLSELSKENSELKKVKAELGKQLMSHMKQHNMDSYTSEYGTIEYKRTVSKPSSCNKQALKDGLEEADWARIKDAEQLTEYVFSKLDSKTSESLKRKKPRKSRKKKSDQQVPPEDDE